MVRERVREKGDRERGRERVERRREGEKELKLNR